MEKKEVEKKVIKILAKIMCLEAANINCDSHLVNDLGVDSFNVVEIFHSIQQEFEIEIPQKALTKISKVRDMVDYLVSHCKIEK